MSSLIFLFLFLPVSVFLYYVVSPGARPYILLLVSLIFYGCACPQYFILFLILVAVNKTDRIIAEIEEG